MGQLSGVRAQRVLAKDLCKSSSSQNPLILGLKLAFSPQNFKTGDTNNQTRFSNSEYDSLAKQIESMSPGVAREKLIQQAQKILIDEALIVLVYHYVQNTAVSSRVKDFKINPFGLIRFSELRVE